MKKQVMDFLSRRLGSKTKWNTKFRSVTDGVQYKNKMSRIKSLKPLLFQRITYILNVKIVSHISSVTVLESNFSNYHNIFVPVHNHFGNTVEQQLMISLMGS